MTNGRGNGAPLQSKAFDETCGDVAVDTVAFDDGNFNQVARGVGAFVAAVRFDHVV